MIQSIFFSFIGISISLQPTFLSSPIISHLKLTQLITCSKHQILYQIINMPSTSLVVEDFSIKQSYCFISIRSVPEFVFAIVLLLITIALLWYAFAGYRSLQKLGKVRLLVKFIFLFVVLAGIVLIIQYSEDSVYYFEELFQKDKEPDRLLEQSIFNYFCFTFGGFLVQTFLILVTMNMYQQLQSSVYNTFECNSQQGEIFSSKLINFYQLIRTYTYVRFLRLIPLLLMPFFKEEASVFALLNYVCNCVDSLLSFIAMMICYFLILKPFLFKKNFLDQIESKKLKREYLSLVASAFYRFISVSFFLYISESNQDQECPSQTLLNSLEFFFVGEPLLKLFPLYVTIRMQLPKVDDLQIKKSLMKQHGVAFG